MRKWTVGEHVGVGFVLMLLLLLGAASMGAFALLQTVRSFQAAVEQQGRSLVGALRQRKAIGSANTNVLRYLLTRDEKFITARDSDMPRARQALAELRDSSPTAELRTGWAEVLATLDSWDEAAKADIAAEEAKWSPIVRKAGLKGE